MTLQTKTESAVHVATWKGFIELTKKEASGYTSAEVKVTKEASLPLYVPLKRDAWTFEVVQNRLWVRPPALQFGSASVDNAHPHSEILDTSWRISETRMLRDATSQLDQRAQELAEANAREAIPTAREGVTAFIREWVLKQHFPENSEAEIVVIFPGESDPVFAKAGGSAAQK